MATTTATATVNTSQAEQRYVTFHAANGEAQRPILEGDQLKPTFESIPQIDFTNMYGDLEERRKLAEQVGLAFKESGFLYACNHGISEKVQASVLQVMREFFALPTEEKMKIHINNSAEIKGYECLFETKLDTTTRGGKL